MVRAKGLLGQMSTLTSVAAFLYQGSRTLHSLLGTGFGNKESPLDVSSLSSSDSGPTPQNTEPRPKSALILIHVSMMESKTFDLVDVFLKHHQWAGDSNHRSLLVKSQSLLVTNCRQFQWFRHVNELSKAIESARISTNITSMN